MKKSVPANQSSAWAWSRESPDTRAGKRATARHIAGIQAPNHRPSHVPPSTKWPPSSTPPSPRASPPPRCVSIRRGPLARASSARFRADHARTPHPALRLPTSKPLVQNIPDPIHRASSPSTARRRPPHLLRQGCRRSCPRAVRVTPDRSRARGPFPATVRDVICCGVFAERGARAGVPTARRRKGPPFGALGRPATRGRVVSRSYHARSGRSLSTRAPRVERAPARATPARSRRSREIRS